MKPYAAVRTVDFAGYQSLLENAVNAAGTYSETYPAATGASSKTQSTHFPENPLLRNSDLLMPPENQTHSGEVESTDIDHRQQARQAAVMGRLAWLG